MPFPLLHARLPDAWRGPGLTARARPRWTQARFSRGQANEVLPPTLPAYLSERPAGQGDRAPYARTLASLVLFV